MKQAILSITFFLAITQIAVTGINAQLTISVPKIPKIGKPKIGTQENVQPTTTTTTTSDTADRPANNTGSSTNWWIDYQIGKIAEYKKDLESWNPTTEVFPKPNSSDDYITLALSKKERSAWLKEKKVEPDARLDAALDAVKDLLHKLLPEVKIDSKTFNYRNAAEEKLVLAEMSDVPGLKVFKIGFNQSTWLIDKNNLGIPKARYKHGLVYGRNPASEDPFCRIWYVNVIQDYAGGGTYGATRARYIDKEIIACPAGQ